MVVSNTVGCCCQVWVPSREKLARDHGNRLPVTWRNQEGQTEVCYCCCVPQVAFPATSFAFAARIHA